MGNTERPVGLVLDIILRGLFVIAALVLFGGVYIVWETGQFAVSPARQILYGLLPGGVGVLCLILATSSRTIRILALINGSAAVAAILGVEIYLALPAPTNQTVATQEPQEVLLPMICPTNLLEETNGGVDAVLHDESGNPLLPFGGISNTEINHQIAANGVYSSTRADRFGFSNPDSVWSRPAADVLLLGDSFTFGADVAFGRGYSDILREMYPDTVNLGCGGNGPLSALASLAEYGAIVNPKLVIWFYFEGNDLTKDFHRESAAEILRAYLESDSTQNLASRQQEIDSTLAGFWADVVEDREQASVSGAPSTDDGLPWRQIATLVNLRTVLGIQFRIDDWVLRDLERVVSKMRVLTEESGASLLVVELPSESRWSSPLATMDAAAYSTRVEEVILNAGADWLSVVDAMEATGAPRALYNGHFTEEGYRLVADTVLERVAPLLGEEP